MGIFKVFLGDTYIKGETIPPKLRAGTSLKNIKIFLGDKLRYQMPISGATATCSSATYNGTTQTAQNITVVLSGQTLTNGVDYTVTNNSGGINASSYQFTVSGINYFNTSVNGTFTINPKVVTNPIITLEPSSYTYSGNQCKPTPTVKDGSTIIPSSCYTVSYSNNTNAGIATCTITDKSGGNYTVSGSKTFTIGKVTPTVTAPVAKTNLVYTSSAQALATNGSTDFGTIQYCPTSGGTYTTAMISGTNASSYDVWYKVVGNSNVNDVAPAKITVSIAKANPTYTAPTAKTGLTYNGSAQTLLNVGSTSHGTIQYSSDNSTWSTTLPTSTNANDSITVYWRLVGDSNHKDVNSTAIVCSIAKADPTYTAPTAKTGLTYNGSAQALLNAGSTSDGTMQYSSNNSTWSTTIPTGTNATAYTSYWRIVGDANHNDKASASISTTISKVTPTVTAPVAKSLTYNGSAQQLATAGSTNFGTLKYSLDNSTYTTSVPSGTNATSYTLYYKVDGDSNINSVAAKSISCSIAKADPAYTAPTAKNTTYNGSAQALLNAGAVTGGTIYYSSDNSTWSTTIPSGTNATTYTSYWKITGDSNHNDKASASINTTISKAAGSVTTAPTAKSLTYNNTDQTLVNAGSGTGTMLYKLGSGSWGTSIPTGKAAGDYTVYYKASASTNYNESASGSVAVNIAKVTPTVTAPTAKSLTYNGNAQALVNAGSTNWGTLQYSLDNSTWSTNIPTGTDATGYTVYYKVVGNANINNIAAKSLNVTIAKANPTYTAPTKKTGLVYNGSAQNLLNAGSTSHGTIQYSSDNSTWSTTIPQGTNASSTYKAYWRLVGDSNHNDVASTEISSISIAKVTPTVTAPTPKTLTFNNANQVLANAGSTNYGTIQYCLNNSGGTYSTTVPSASAANTTYKVWYKVVGNSNVNDVAPASIDCMIAEKRVTTPTITLDPSSYTYNGSARQPSVTVKDGSTVIPSSEYTVSYSNNTNAGTATVTITDKDAGNYYISGTTTFTISKVTPTVTAPTAKSLTYNTSAQTLANAGSTNYGTLQYSTTSGGTYSTTIPQGTNAGSYEVWYKVVGNSNVNSTNPVKVSCSIAKATGTATVNGTTNTYNGSAKNLVSVSNNTGTMHYKVDNGGWSTTLPQATNAGSWTIYWYMDASTNYNGIASSDTRYVSSSIGKAAGSVTTAPTAKSLTYNASAQALVNAGSGTGTMMYKLDSGSWGTSIPTATNATSYTVYYKASASTNYNESASGSVSCSIAKVTPTVTAPKACGLTYTGSAQNLVSGGSTNYGTLVYSTTSGGTYSTTIPQGTNAGSYEVWYKVSGNSNVNSTTAVKVACSIAKANTTYTAPTANNRTYDTTSKALLNAGAVTGGTIYYSSDNSTWSTTIPSQTNAGTYTSYWKITGDSNHSDKASASISTTVSPKTVSNPTITLSQSTYTYSNSACQPTPTVKDGSTTIPSSEYTVSYSNNTNVGTATCTITDKTGGNYTVSGSKTFTITCYSATAPTAKSLTYNTAAQTLANAGSTSYGTMVYCSTSGGTFSTTIPTGTNAGSYEVWWKVTGNTNVCNTAATKVACSIGAKTVNSPTITLSQSTYTYANTAFQPTPTVKDGSTTIASSEYTVSYSNNTNVGTATCTITDKSGGNYTVNGSKTFTINCYSATAPTNKNPNWTGSAQAYANAGSTSYGTMVYCTTSGGTFTTTLPTGTNAGSYDLWWKVTGNTNVCNTAATKVACSIAKVAMTYTAPKAATRNYNGSAQQIVSGASANGGSIYYATSSAGASSSTTVPTQTAAGTYSTYWKAVPDSNHSGGTSSWAQITSCVINKVAMTYTAPKVTTYTYGNTARALVSGASANGGSIQYCATSGGTYSTTVPTQTNAGTYDTWWKAVPDSNHSGGTNAAKLTTTVNCYSATAPTAKNPNWTGSAQALINAGSTSYGTMVYSTSSTGTFSTTIPTGTNAGSYEVWWKVTGNTNVCNTAATKVACSIKQVAMTYTAPTAKSGLNYTGSAQNLVTAGGATGGTIQFSTSQTGTYTTTIPQGTTAGTYTTWWKAVPDSNHSGGTNAASLSTTIAKVAMTYTAPKATTYTYGNTARNAASGGSASGGSIKYSTSQTGTYSTTIPTNTNIGTYDFWWKAEPDSNHSGGTSAAKLTATINCYTASAPTNKNPTYNGSAQAYANAGSTTYGTMVYCSTSGGTFTTSVPTATNAGSYECWYKVTGNTNVCPQSATKVACTIAAKTVSSPTITLSPTSYTWNNTERKPTPTVKDGSTTIASSEYTVSYSNNKAAGTATCTITDKSGGNYTVSGSKTFTISKYTPTAPTAKSLTYNGSAQALVNAGSTSFGSIVYSTTSGGTYSTTIPTGTNADSYEVWWKLSGDSTVTSNCNNTGATKISITIAKAACCSTAPKATTYTYANTARNLVSGGSSTCGTMQYCTTQTGTYSGTIPTQTNAGTYTTYWKVSNDSNHSGTCSGSVSTTIAKYTPTAPKATTYTYNGSARALVSGGSTTYGTMVYSTDNTNFSTTVPTATNAGSYTVYWKVTGNTNVNNTASTSISCSIAKKTGCAISFATTSVSKTYGNAPFTNAITNTGDGSITWSSSNTGVCTVNSSGQVTIKAAGSCTISATTTSTTNCTYSTTAATYTITVSKASQTAPTATGATVCYGNTATASASGGGGQGSIEWSNGNSRTAVGTTSTAARWSGNSNYNASSYSSAVNLTVTATWCSGTTWSNTLTWPSA